MQPGPRPGFTWSPLCDRKHAFLWAELPANKDADLLADLWPPVRWLGRHWLPVSELANPAVGRRVLYQLTLRLDG